jgi:hypothetical protein
MGEGMEKCTKKKEKKKKFCDTLLRKGLKVILFMKK